jgi:hypothetical protein
MAMPQGPYLDLYPTEPNEQCAIVHGLLIVLTIAFEPYPACQDVGVEPSEPDRFCYLLAKLLDGLGGSAGGSFWAIGGNANTTTESFGTTSNQDVSWISNNTARGTLKKTGQWIFGSGTTTSGIVNVIGGGHAAGITMYIQNDDNSQSFQFNDSGVIGRNGAVFSIAPGTTTTWGTAAGQLAGAQQGIFIGYYAGANCTNSNVIAINGSTNNTTSANYGMELLPLATVPSSVALACGT